MLKPNKEFDAAGADCASAGKIREGLLNSATDDFRPWEQFRDRQRWLFLAILFLIAAASYADRQLMPVVLEAIKLEFNLSDRMLGALGGAPFALCFAISSFPFARVADSGNRKFWLILAFALWTVATILCGLAPTLLLLFIARMGVGAGEGGALPVSHALIANYFPPRSRGRAFAIFTAAITVGSTAALAGGGWLAQTYGWRMAFVLMGVASLPIFLLAVPILREPPRAPVPAGQPVARASFTRDIGVLMKKRSFVLLVLGFTSYSLFAYGPLVFVPAFLIREMHQNMAVIGAAYGIASAIGTVLGTLAAALFCDRLFAHDQRWLVWWPAICYLIAVPISLMAFSADSFTGFLFWIALLPIAQFASLPAVFSAVQHVCGASRRVTAPAIVLASINAIGLTLGPLATGAISDALAATDVVRPLGHALMVMTAALVPGAILMWLAARWLPGDAE
jgi:predicted MFS family arabinose efflux permease